jgi:hypothetical protein
VIGQNCIRRLASDQLISLETNVETAASNREIVRRAFDAWAAGTGSPFELLAEDAQWTIVGRSDAAKTYRNLHEYLCLGPRAARGPHRQRDGVFRQHRVQRLLASSESQSVILAHVPENPVQRSAHLSSPKRRGRNWAERSRGAGMRVRYASAGRRPGRLQDANRREHVSGNFWPNHVE